LQFRERSRRQAKKLSRSKKQRPAKLIPITVAKPPQS